MDFGFRTRGNFGNAAAISGQFGSPLRRSSLFEEMEKTRFADTVAQKMGTGVAQGNGGYATGQSPEELFKKAQTGLLGSQGAENKAQADRLRLFTDIFGNENMMKRLMGEPIDPNAPAPSLGMKPQTDSRFIQFPGVGGMTPQLQPQAAPQGPNPYDAAEQAKRWGTTGWQ